MGSGQGRGDGGSEGGLMGGRTESRWGGEREGWCSRCRFADASYCCCWSRISNFFGRENLLLYDEPRFFFMLKIRTVAHFG